MELEQACETKHRDRGDDRGGEGGWKPNCWRGLMNKRDKGTERKEGKGESGEVVRELTNHREVPAEDMIMHGSEQSIFLHSAE